LEPSFNAAARGFLPQHQQPIAVFSGVQRRLLSGVQRRENDMTQSTSNSGVATTDAATAVPKRGYVYVVVAAFLWAISGTSAKVLFNHGITAFDLVQMRVTFAGTLLLLWVVFRKPGLMRVAPRDLWSLLLLGTVGLATVQFTYLLAISKIKVAAAILLQYLAPVLIALHAVIFARERLTATTLTAVTVATIGCYLVVGAYNLDLLALNRVGIISGLASAVSYAWYAGYGERCMRLYPPWTVLFYSLLFAAVVWNVVQPPLAFVRQSYSAMEWTLIIYIAVFGTLVPYGLYLEGISLIRSTRASITATLEPIAAGLISYSLLGETLEPLQLVGGALVIAAVVLLQLRREYDDKTPTLLRTRPPAGARQ
jgi:drug/metabolite transporter, DME family